MVSRLTATGKIITILLIVQLSCSIGTTAATETPTPTLPGATPTGIVEPSPTTELPTATVPAQVPTDTGAPIPTATTGPQCTVLQDLNLRPGPGLAYNPIIRALPAQTLLTPLGFNPEGVPGGSWVQVKDEANNQIGWVSAGAPFVSCNIDLASLPTVAVPPPPPPPPPNTETSAPDGSFPENLIWEDDFDSNFLLRLYAYDSNTGSTEDGAGISEVIFTVTDADGNQVLENSEGTAGFCVFGGGEPDCNPWVFEDFVYKWTPGGEVIVDGSYELEVRVILDSLEEGNWRYQVEVDLQ